MAWNRYLRNEYRKGDKANFGVIPPPAADKHGYKLARLAVPHIIEADERKDAVLWPVLFKAFPGWRHGNQGTGDCVSWEWAHKLDVLMAVLVLLKKLPQEIVARTCSESIYALGRVEIYGKNYAGGAGMYGGGAAKAVLKLGTLHRLQYEGHDLRKYSGSRAISWGRNGLPDELEPIAKEHRAGDSICVTDPIAAGALLQSGYPVGYCGSTSWGQQRGPDGIAIRHSRGSHGMCITGVRYDDSNEPLAFWVANTGHGNHCSGPVGPIPVPVVYAECGSWVHVSKIRRVFAAGDCFAHSMYQGFPLQKIPDWGTSNVLG